MRGDKLARAGKWLQAAADQALVDHVQLSLVAGHVDPDSAAFGGAADVAVLAHPDERPEILRGHHVAFLSKELDRRFRQQRFGDREHAVQVENHTT